MELNTRRWGWFFAALVVVTGWSTIGLAQASEAYDELLKANKFASRGSISRSIKHYEKVLELAPQAYPQAFFNLAEVYRAKGDCHRAVLLYSLFALSTEDAGELKETDRAKRGCGKGFVDVTIETPRGVVKIDGYLWASQGKTKSISLLPGSYQVEVSAVDHHPQSKTIELTTEPVVWKVALEKMQFFGTLIVGDVGVPGAHVRIFLGVSEASKLVYEGALPMTSAVTLPEGKHFVEVVAPDRNRWIRNVQVGRDDQVSLEVTLTPAKPPEIR